MLGESVRASATEAGILPRVPSERRQHRKDILPNPPHPVKRKASKAQPKPRPANSIPYLYRPASPAPAHRRRNFSPAPGCRASEARRSSRSRSRVPDVD